MFRGRVARSLRDADFGIDDLHVRYEEFKADDISLAGNPVSVHDGKLRREIVEFTHLDKNNRAVKLQMQDESYGTQQFFQEQATEQVADRRSPQIVTRVSRRSARPVLRCGGRGRRAFSTLTESAASRDGRSRDCWAAVDSGFCRLLQVIGPWIDTCKPGFTGWALWRLAFHRRVPVLMSCSRRSGLGSLRRAKGRRPVHRVALVVTEGTRDEPAYFKSLKAHLRLAGVKVVASGRGSSPISVVDYASSLCHEVDYDEVWCVFDRDTHHRFGDAVSRARKRGFKTAVSVPCFEIWLMLHLRYSTRPRQPAEAKEVLARLLEVHSVDV